MRTFTPPYHPPTLTAVQMLTPSGRFQPDKKICFSMSDFHPGSVSTLMSTMSCYIPCSFIYSTQWNPAWSVATMYVRFCPRCLAHLTCPSNLLPLWLSYLLD